MVAAARKEREAADRKSDQLRAQLNDAELLLASHQEQLADLKEVMHQMSLEHEDIDLNAACSTAPSTPAMQTQESMSRFYDALHLTPTSPGVDDISPAPPTSFAHLIHPVLRTDLNAYDDFQTLLQLSRKSSPTSRVSNGIYGSLDAAGLNKLARKEQPHVSGHVPFNGSTSSLSTPGTHQSSPITPSSTNSSISSRDMPVTGILLKETRFYKRALTEDIEPTLRLDTAPGLSWLARRTVINSMSEGGLVVEPMPAAVRSNVFACSLCGENRQDMDHARLHRFRTSENENAQRYPLCGFCLSRVRASCDFLGFLRMLKDGHWRTGGEEEEMQAWEECVKLRERMFWARIGGGVVPAFLRARDSPRSSVEQHNSNQSKNDIKRREASQDELVDLHHTTGNVATDHDKDLTQVRTGAEGGSDPDKPLTQPATGPVNSAYISTASGQLESELQSSTKDMPRGLGIENASSEVHNSNSRILITVPGGL